MSKHKLVPLEPTYEMALAAMNADTHANYKYGEPADFLSIWSAMLAAAPDVQGEPVTWSGWGCQYPGKMPRLYGDRRIAELNCDWENGDQVLHFTAAPQPAEQQPDPTDAQILAITTAYEQGVGKGHDAHHRGEEIQNPYGTSWGCDKAWHMGYEEGKKQAANGAKSSAVKPRPAPDVSELVDALTMARETIAAALRANAPDYFTTDSDIARHVAIQHIDTALAVFRKGGSTDGE